MDFLVSLNAALDGHLVWILPLASCGLVHIIIWNFSYKTYIIRGKHRSGKDITKVVHDVSEEKAVKAFRDFHKGTEVYSVQDTDQNGAGGTY
jgi:hypothetical protein